MFFKLKKRFNQASLYKISINNNEHLIYYTNHKRSVIFNGNEYKPFNIYHGKISATSEKNKGSVTVTMPLSGVMVDYFLRNNRSAIADLDIYHVDLSAPSAPDNSLNIFKGRLISAEARGRKLVLTFLNFVAYASKLSNTNNFSAMCQHALYSDQCAATPITFTGQVTNINGNVITVQGASNYSDDFFTLGKFDHNADVRMIVKHVGDDVTLSTPPSNLILGDSVTLFAGCDKTASTCQSKFNNMANFGGFKYIPVEDIVTNGGRIA